MSGEDIIQQRGTALENQFFAAVDAKLMAELQAELGRADAVRELAKISGIEDRSALEALAAAGVAPSAYPALRLFPLVAVAWADGMLEKAEREQVLKGAEANGVQPGTASGSLLEAWLSQKPSEELFVAWEAFAGALIAKLDAPQGESLRRSILNDVRNVAQAAGGILGWAAICKGEHAVMNRIERALSR